MLYLNLGLVYPRSITMSDLGPPRDAGFNNMPILIKSLTPPKKILSITFPKVPPMSNAAIVRLIFLLVKSRIKTAIPPMLINMMMMSGTGNDREIPSLNAGVNREMSSRNLLL